MTDEDGGEAGAKAQGRQISSGEDLSDGNAGPKPDHAIFK